MDIPGLLLQLVIWLIGLALSVVPALVAGVFAKALISPLAFWPAFVLGMVIFLCRFEPLRFFRK